MCYRTRKEHDVMGATVCYSKEKEAITVRRDEISKWVYTLKIPLSDAFALILESLASLPVVSRQPAPPGLPAVQGLALGRVRVDVEGCGVRVKEAFGSGKPFVCGEEHLL